jgi:hypothetical protein
MAQIWTGTGYHEVPDSIAANLVGNYTTGGEWYSNGDNGMMQNPTQSYYGVSDPNSIFGMSYGNNLANVGSTQDQLSFMLKSGDKEGTGFNYMRGADGNYTLDQAGMNLNQWETNPGAENMWLAIVASAGLGGAALAPAAAGAGAVGGTVAPGALIGAGESAAALWPGATGLTAGSGAAGVGAALPSLGGAESGGMSLADLASSAGSSISDYVANPSNWSQIAQLGGLLAGGIAGANSSGGSGSAQQPAIPINTPPLWGVGGNPGGWMGGGGYKPQQGPTQTQGMFNQYMGQQQAGLPGMGMAQPNAGKQFNYTQGLLPPDMARRPNAGLIGPSYAE